jgi:hypothetical protein
MKRFAILGLAALAVLGPLAGTASSRGDGWQPLDAQPYDAACGATTVHVTFPVNREFYRVVETLPDGTIHYQITGALFVTYSTDAGASVTVNASGPGDQFAFPNGDFEAQGRGLNSFTFTAEHAAALGVPQISVSAGPIDVTFHADGTVSGHMGNIIEDVCAELGA